MIMSTTKDNLLKAHRSMSAVLDAKFKDVAEWQAFRDIDKALLDFITETPTPAMPAPTKRVIEVPHHGRPPSETSYVVLGLAALEEFGEPIPTPQMVEFIASRREIPEDPDRAKMNISTSLSKDDRFQSVPWRGGRAWWFAKRPIPKESAGSSVNS
jgi:hypothetical protein